jgi:glycosyltransferase involved in cell wall biosynthesis
VKAGRSLNIAFLTSARVWRGSGVSLSHIAHGLADRGHQSYLFAGDDVVVDGFLQRGLPAKQVPTSDTSLRGALILFRELRAIQADCLVVDRPRDLRLGALASLGHSLAIVNRYNLSRPTPPRDLLSRLAYRRVQLTIFVSRTSAQRALSGGPYIQRCPYRIIHEGVGEEFHPDPSAAAAFRAEWGLGRRDFILAVGSLTAEKRYEFLLQVLKRLGPTAPLLVVCGGGPLKEKLEAQAHQLGVEARLLGTVPSALLRGAYAAALCLVHACEVETFGLSVLEAMACGCAVIAVNGGAVPEVLGETGLLNPAHAPEPFAASVRELLASPDRRLALGRAARQRAVQRFSLTRMQREHAEAIESICFGVGPEFQFQHVQAAPPHP